MTIQKKINKNKDEYQVMQFFAQQIQFRDNIKIMANTLHISLYLLFFVNQIETIINPVTIQYVEDDAFVINKVSELLNVKYLEPFQGNIPKIYQGIIRGLGLRAFINIPVRLNHQKCPTLLNIIFKIDTGSPITTITFEAINKLFDLCSSVEKIQSEMYTLQIGGRNFQVSKSQSYYHNLNILGANFMREVNGQLSVSYSQDLSEKVVLEFDVNVLKDDDF